MEKEHELKIALQICLTKVFKTETLGRPTCSIEN